MTHFNPDDPKWTAYVLGELDENERAAVEAELEASDEAKLLVEELRFAANLTRMELRDAVVSVGLREDQRESIRAASAAATPRRWFGFQPRVWMSGAAAAAAAVLVLAVVVSRPPTANRSVGLAEPAAPAAPTPTPLNPTAQNLDSAKPASDFGLRYEHPTQEAGALRDDRARKAATEPAAPPIPPPGMPSGITNSVTTAQVPTNEAALAAPKLSSGPGRVSGSVKDASAALIPGVTVTATNVKTGASETSTTNASGAFEFKDLQPGDYKLSSSLPGFQTAVDAVSVAANTEEKHDVTLQVGAAAESVEVSVASAALKTELSGRLQSLPLTTRPQSFAAGQPAVPPAAPSMRFAPGVPFSADRVSRDRAAVGESYDSIRDNSFLLVAQNPLSTFSIDVDTASYANMRRFLSQNTRPPRDAVRIEEMVNYFSYDYPQPTGNNPIGASIEAAAAPWNPQHRLVRIGIKGREMEARRRPASNLVFLLDVSGSMQPEERLPMLKNALRMLIDQLNANDKVTVVTYAGTTGVALRPTRGDQKDVIRNLIDSLQAGGSTNGGSGIQLAYEQATANFISGGVNRVILATDGDFNVGITDRNALLRLIEEKAKSGVFLTVLGVGMGNYKDSTLEMLADKGHGNYAYLDTLNEARKVLVEQMSGTLVTVAKDVKIQVEFNPAVVDAYRLIGYENRALRNEDFNNDLKDAGDVGAGHTVTALYEVVPRGVAINSPGVDPLKYQPTPQPAPNASNETLTVKIRYKEPTATDSKLLVFPLVDREQTFVRASSDFRFSAAVASFGMILRDSPYKGTSTIESVLSTAEDSLGPDRNGYRREFLQLVERARQIGFK